MGRLSSETSARALLELETLEGAENGLDQGELDEEELVRKQWSRELDGEYLTADAGRAGELADGDVGDREFPNFLVM